MTSEMLLRESIRERKRRGLLPPAPGGKAFAGYGEGKSCDCCGEVIAPTDVEYEVDVVRADGARRSIIAHLTCFQIWCDESSETSFAITPPKRPSHALEDTVRGEAAPEWPPWSE